MRLASGSCCLLMAGISLLLNGCGGGSGGGGAATTSVAVGVSAAQNPVLVGESSTVTVSFANYTGTIRFGTPVSFAVSSPGRLSASTVATQAGGIASVSLTSPQAGSVTVSASSGNFAGSTVVRFIPQPDAATVHLIITPPVTSTQGLGALQVAIQRTGGGTFAAALPENSLSGNVYPGFTNVDGSLITGAEKSGVITVGAITRDLTAGITTGQGLPVAKLQYTNISSGLPTFRAVPISSGSGMLALDPKGSPLGLTTANIHVSVDYLKNGQPL